MSNPDHEHIRLNDILPWVKQHFHKEGCQFDDLKVVRCGADQDGRGVVAIQAVPQDPDQPQEETCRLQVRTISEDSCRVLCVATHKPGRQFHCTFVRREEKKDLIGKEEVTRVQKPSGLTETGWRIVFCGNVDVGLVGSLPGGPAP